MKQICYMLIVALSATMLMAGGIDKVVMKVEKAAMGSVRTVDTTSKITGYINRIDFAFGNSTSTVDIALTSSNVFTGLGTTYITLTDVATNVSYQLTNYVQRLCVLEEAFTMNATNAAYTNQSVQCTVIYFRP